MLSVEKKKKVIKASQIHDQDTGSPEVQISILNSRIKQTLGHLKKHPADIHTKRGLLKMVAKRRKFLKYLKRKQEERYSKAVKGIKEQG